MSGELADQAAIARPLWVMLGGQSGDPAHPCRLIASSKLSRSELVAKWDRARGYFGLPPWPGLPPIPEITLTVHMDDCVIIDGPDWQTCLAELFRTWQPEGHQLALPGGDQ